jgi:cell pole-organizing protein PopZ
MSAANPKSQEPSMEEILASIRRIIADDQEVAKSPPAPKPAPAQPVPAPAPVPPRAEPLEEDVLELSEVARPVKLATRPLPEDEPPEIDFREVAEAPFRPEPSELAPPPHPAEPAPAAPMAQPARELEPPDELISNSTHAAVGQAFNMLAHTVLSSNARTLEDLVREMLRPMLKNWLDDNLPTVVERLVRAEIERVARGRR